jgi:hypothetical protein
VGLNSILIYLLVIGQTYLQTNINNIKYYSNDGYINVFNFNIPLLIISPIIWCLTWVFFNQHIAHITYMILMSLWAALSIFGWILYFKFSKIETEIKSERRSKQITNVVSNKESPKDIINSIIYNLNQNDLETAYKLLVNKETYLRNSSYDTEVDRLWNNYWIQLNKKH